MVSFVANSDRLSRDTCIEFCITHSLFFSFFHSVEALSEALSGWGKDDAAVLVS